MKQPCRVSTYQLRKKLHKSIKQGCLIVLIFCLSLFLCNNFVIANEFPTIHLLSPTGGETLSGIVEVSWNSMGDNVNLDIFLYCAHVDNMSWVLITPEGIDDSGRYSWNTLTLSDGAYRLRVQGINHENEMGLDTSDVLIIDNNQANIYITEVMILDKSINSTKVVKDLDSVEIYASIISDENLSSFYQEALAVLNSPVSLANIVANDVVKELKGKQANDSKASQPDGSQQLNNQKNGNNLQDIPLGGQMIPKEEVAIAPVLKIEVLFYPN